MPTYEFKLTDSREITLMRLDPDQAEGFAVWIKAFLTDLENRYKSLGVKAEIKLEITLKDPAR